MILFQIIYCRKTRRGIVYTENDSAEYLSEKNPEISFPD